MTEHMEVGQGTVGVLATSPRSPTKPQKLLHGDLPPVQPKQVSEMRRQVHGRQICRKALAMQQHTSRFPAVAVASKAAGKHGHTLAC